MKTKMKVLYWILALSILLSACAPGSAATTQATHSAVIPTAKAAAAATQAAPVKNSGVEKQSSAGLIPPAEAIAACTGKSEQAACEFTAQKGTETGLCETVQNQLACSPKKDPAGGTQSGGSQSGGTQPGGTQPGGTQSGGTQPGGTQSGGTQPGGGQPGGGQPGYNIEQAISDKAQGMTIAYDALAFLTGDLGSDSFFPPGKVADFWGFQYLRDNDPSEMGHAGDFLTSAAMNTLNVLNSSQRAQLVTLARSQVSSISEYGYMRFTLIDAFRRLVNGELPGGTTGLSEAAIKAYSAKLYLLDGEISFARAERMGSLINALDKTQLAALDSMVGKGMLEWPAVVEPADIQGLEREVKVAVMTYAADMYAWYAGSVEADVYFCPERHGTYFGSFYLKDIPAMGNPQYAIPTDLTGDMGEAMLQVLNTTQAGLITGLVDVQKPYLTGIVDARTQISTELRKFLAGGTADKATVMSLMQQYGELDGSIIYNLALNFTKVNQTLTSEQKTKLMAFREEMLADLMYPKGAYLYSQPIPMPAIPNTDFLFK
jgi:hypothetical protein